MQKNHSLNHKPSKTPSSSQTWHGESNSSPKPSPKKTPPPFVSQIEKDIQKSWQQALRIAQSLVAEGDRIKQKRIQRAQSIKKQILQTARRELSHCQQQLIDTQQNLKVAHQNLHRSVRDFSNLQQKVSQLKCELLILEHKKKHTTTASPALIHSPTLPPPAIVFWRKVALSVGVSFVALVFGVAFRKPLKQNVRALQSQAIDYLKRPSASDLYSAQALAQHREAIKFNPPQSPHIKNTYTDNILYTKGYMKFEKSPTYKKAWTQQAARHLVEQLEVDEAVAAQILGKEAALISSLEDLKHSIDNRQPHLGISKMRVREKEFNTYLHSRLSTASAQNFQQFKLKFTRGLHPLASRVEY